MKVALVHDFLREYGGAERVVEALHEIWPEAPLYTSFVDWRHLGDQGWRFKDWDIRTVPVLIPGIKAVPIPGIRTLQDWILRKFHSPLRFLAPKIWESFDPSGYDVVISSSGWFICRGVRAGERFPEFKKSQFRESQRLPLHICYIHHPPRNLYGYATGSLYQKYAPVRAYATVVNFFMRHYDWETAQRVDYFVANSQETARRVWKFYRRESAVIYPPVELQGDTRYVIRDMQGRKNVSRVTSHVSRSYFLSVGRLMWAKRVDLAIEAANRLKFSLKVVGTSPEDRYLRWLAGPTVEFLGSVSDSELAELYSGARATIFTALDEDFGIVSVESMAAGTPVIALAQGGVVESVVKGVTGVFFSEPTTESLISALKTFLKMKRDWSPECQKQAEKFSKERFKREFKAFVEAKFQSTSSK